MSATEQLDQLVAALDDAVQGAGGDAIDDLIAAPPRTTTVVSLKNHDTVRRFREELSDGLIRADTANRLLALVGTIINHLTGGGAAPS